MSAALRGPEPASVLVVGAGPTGLVLALWLTHFGVRVRLIDAANEPGTTSRAVVVHARTLELYAQLGLEDAVVRAGRKLDGANFWARGRRVGRVRFGDFGSGLSPYPFAVMFPQDAHERLLIDRLATAGVTVERNTTLTNLNDRGAVVETTLRSADAGDERCTFAYVAGCDGAHSAVRHACGIAFPGGTYSRLFFVADLVVRGALADGEMHAAVDASDLAFFFPLPQTGNVRLIGTIDRAHDAAADALRWEDVAPNVIARSRVEIDRVNWFSTYRVHHRVAESFRRGRAFLLGDAAHIHSPVGGQGMNTGIGDAIDLAWKLAHVLQRTAGEELLDTYEPERIAFARQLIATTDRIFVIATSDGAFARTMRTRVVPRLAPALMSFGPIRRAAFRRISQIGIAYGTSPLSAGRSGRLRGGDRLPWIPAREPATEDNFAPLRTRTWQLHVYGTVPAALRAYGAAHDLPVYAFAWHDGMGAAGIVRDAAFLVRPDGYIALAGTAAEAVAAYAQRWRLAWHARADTLGS